MKYNIKFNDQENVEISSENLDQLNLFKTNDKEYHILEHNISYQIHVESINMDTKSLVYYMNDIKYEVTIENELDTLIASLGFKIQDDDAMNELKSPMPGVIIDVLVTVGQSIDEGDQLIVLEAMKMENMLKSHGSGTIKNIHVQNGDAVEKDQLLITFEEVE